MAPLPLKVLKVGPLRFDKGDIYKTFPAVHDIILMFTLIPGSMGTLFTTVK